MLIFKEIKNGRQHGARRAVRQEGMFYDKNVEKRLFSVSHADKEESLKKKNQ